MERNRLRELLEKVAGGKLDVSQAVERLRILPFEELDFAKVDHHRSLRRGFPEVIFCEGKTAEQVEKIALKIIGQGVNLLATRCAPELFAALEKKLPGAVYHRDAALFAVEQTRAEKVGKVAVVSGGTSDRSVSEEAACTADYLGCDTKRYYDVGVAGIHRLLSCWEEIRLADVIVVVAGMEGALASVVAGMAEAPVIAVPTSIGYGASFGGLAALLAMLNSCAGGVTVVNIDNGFGAAYAAAVICRKLHRSAGE
ncbi:MAG: nickel pincer cofactor biosynthesis protein LarB [Candidatus Krumholzibacteriota bacterium]|nr:nickel pincer cofactor biosynthesis protein LarB [Candidatus Krumholzibacteriota bacterium]